MAKIVSAGGVVFRRSPGVFEILMMKDRFDMWALPKGKVEEGESLEETALREIEEEIGLEGKAIAYLGESEYVYEARNGEVLDKVVKYFLVEVSVDSEVIIAPEEVKDTEWMSFMQAYDLDIYENVREILRRAEDVLSRGIGFDTV